MICNMFNRTIKEEIISFISDGYNNKPVLVLSGARQTGKTTILKNILQEKPHLFLDLETDRSYADRINQFKDFKEFDAWLRDEFSFDPSRQILCIDEAQCSQGLGCFVGAMKEKWPNSNVIITGSLISELYDSATRRPVGRETFLNIWPLTFREFLLALGYDNLVKVMDEFIPGDEITQANHNRFLDAYDVYLKVGGLPEVVNYYLQKRDYKKRRNDIFQSYQDDFARYFNHEDISLFMRCLTAVAQNAGSPSKDSQAVRPNVYGYRKVPSIYGRLEKWKLIIKCDQIGIRPEQNKYHPKRYLYDVGVLCDLRLRGIETVGVRDLENEHLRAPLGGVIENALALSLRSQFDEEIFGIQLAGDSEIDFAVKVQDKIYPVECKMSLRFKNNFLFGI